MNCLLSVSICALQYHPHAKMLVYVKSDSDAQIQCKADGDIIYV